MTRSRPIAAEYIDRGYPALFSALQRSTRPCECLDAMGLDGYASLLFLGLRFAARSRMTSFTALSVSMARRNHLPS